jgi:hypothetical protein
VSAYICKEIGKPPMLYRHKQNRIACVVLFTKETLDGWWDFK